MEETHIDNSGDANLGERFVGIVRMSDTEVVQRILDVIDNLVDGQPARNLERLNLISAWADALTPSMEEVLIVETAKRFPDTYLRILTTHFPMFEGEMDPGELALKILDTGDLAAFRRYTQAVEFSNYEKTPGYEAKKIELLNAYYAKLPPEEAIRAISTAVNHRPEIGEIFGLDKVN